MSYGLWSGILWALDTIIIGYALTLAPFIDNSRAILLAPFISTFLHDTCSAVFLWLKTIQEKDQKNTVAAFRTRSGRFLMLGALLAGPVGMSGYVASIKYMGASNTAIISSMFPALGALFAYLFLKEKMKSHQVVGLAVSILGVVLLSQSTSSESVVNLGLGIFCGLICCIGWASEAVIVAYGFQDDAISDKQALTIRQTTSSLAYGIVLITALQGWPLVGLTFSNSSFVYIVFAALAGTISYLFYYKAIGLTGAIRSMALNITYSAWAILFTFLFFHITPSIKTIICGMMVIFGSIFAASTTNPFKK